MCMCLAAGVDRATERKGVLVDYPSGNQKCSHRYSDGSMYEGEWKNGKRHGSGTFRSISGDVYEGQFQQDRRHGFGKLRTSTGITYEGSWKLGIKDGQASGDQLLIQVHFFLDFFHFGARYGNGIDDIFRAFREKSLTAVQEPATMEVGSMAKNMAVVLKLTPMESPSTLLPPLCFVPSFVGFIVDVGSERRVCSTHLYRYVGEYKNGERVGSSHMVLKTQGNNKKGRLKLKVFGF